ncbi:MAG: hypothetical protein ACRDHP_01705 [Ktedonobacterales bacterium]
MPPYHDWDGPHGGPPFDSFVAAGLSTLFWLVVLGGITWAILRYLQRERAARMQALSDDPSAMELLRRRYVMGHLDVDAFEEMVTHVLASEMRERTYVPPLDEQQSERYWSE